MSTRRRLSARTEPATSVLLGVLFGAGIVVQAVAIANSWGGAYWLFGTVTGMLVGAAALARRVDRMWMAVIGSAVVAAASAVARFADLPSEPGPVTAAALSVLIGSAVRWLPARQAGIVAAGGGVVAAIAFAAGASSPVAVLALAGWLAALSVGLYLRLLDTRRRAAVELVRRDERLELARELHDVVAHHITGIVVQIQAARLVADRHPERLDSALEGIEAAGTDALAAMRRVVGLLRDSDDAAPAAQGTEELTALVSRFDGHGPSIRLRAADDGSAWPPEVATTIYRVVQESLTNVARHAPHANSVVVDVTHQEQTVTVEIADDAGAGSIRRSVRGGYGLIGMRERVEALGGTLHAGRGANGGWTVVASLPIPGAGGTSDHSSAAR